MTKPPTPVSSRQNSAQHPFWYRLRCPCSYPSGPGTKSIRFVWPSPAWCGHEMLPHGGSRAALISCPQRRRTSQGGVQPPSPPPLCRCGSGAVGAGPPLSVRVSGQPRPWPRCRPLSGAFRPRLPVAALCRCPWFGPEVAELPRPAMSNPPQATAGQPAQGVGGLRRRVLRSLVLAHHADGPGHAPAPGQPCHGCEVRAGPVEAPPPATCARHSLSRLQAVPTGAAFSNRTPRRACHGSHSQSASNSGRPFGPSVSFFPVRIMGENREKRTCFFCIGKGGRVGEDRSKGGWWFWNMAGQHAP